MLEGPTFARAEEWTIAEQSTAAMISSKQYMRCVQRGLHASRYEESDRFWSEVGHENLGGLELRGNILD